MSYHRWQNYFSPNFDARNNIDLLRDSSHYLDIFSINNIYGARPKRRCISSQTQYGHICDAIY